jgi:hypothetical protein
VKGDADIKQITYPVKMPVELKAIVMTDMSRYSDADLLGIAVSDNQNLALRGRALAEIECRRREYENARDAKQVEARPLLPLIAASQRAFCFAWALFRSTFCRRD